MKKWGSFLLIVLAVPLTWAANEFKTIKVGDLEQWMKDKKKVLSIYDANMDSTREFVGLIPGAKTLSSSSEYDTKTELPKDKKSTLVFYCANSLCTASHSAAKRAMAAGYSDVSVMIDGIYGWKKEGKPLEKWNLSKDKAHAIKTMPSNNESVDASAVSPQDASAMALKKEAVIVDVREAEERHQVVAGSLWFPMSDLKNEPEWIAFRTQLPKNKRIIIHCAAGVRAKRMANLLKQDGFQTNFFEGPDQWKKAGLPLEKGPAQ